MLDDIRTQYPDYRDMSDADLADGLYRKYYSDMPRAEFDAKVGKPAKAAEPAQPGIIERVKDAFTGHLRTEFPDAPEFLPELTKAGNISIEDAQAGREPAFDPTAVSRSAITSNPAAALDILKKSIPGLEAKQDKFGNLMLKTPGMRDFAYLNKPGASARDLDEIGTQVLATLPFMGAAGAGATIPARIASGAGFMGAGEIARQGMEKAAGSEQGPNDAQLALTTLFGGMFAPGVPTAAAEKVIEGGKKLTGAITNPVRSVVSPDAEAARRVATSFEQTHTGGGQRVLTPEEAQHLAASMLQERMAAPGGEATIGADTRLMDIMGERGRALARSAANTSPEARDTLNAVIQPRFETQSHRAANFLETVGGGDLAGRSRQALEEMAHTARAPFYEATFRAGAHGIETPELARLAQAPAMQDAMRRAQDELLNKHAGGRLVTQAMGPGGRTLEYWDQVKRLLNDQFNRLARQGRNAEAGNIAAITDRLVSILDNEVPSYATARGVSMGLFRANNALEAGENFVTAKLANHEAEQAIAAMTRQEQALFRQGYVSRLIAHINETGDRRNIVNLITNSPAARERLEIALGPRGARELEAFLRSENLMDLARAAVQGNSTTARQLAELGLAGGVGGLVSGFNPSDPAGWIAGVLTKYGAKTLNHAADVRVANRIAEMLVSRDPTVMRRGLQQLSHSGWLNALRSFDNAFAGLPRNAAIEQGARQ